MYRPAPRPLTLVFPTRANEANYLIDNKVGIILDADGTRANRKEEIAITQTMVERVERRFDLRPERLVGDTVYGVARLLKWLVDRKITPHVPVWDKSARHDGTFSRADFVFDQERNVYICPGGKELTSPGNIDQGHIVYYRANKHDCSTCSLKPKCTTAPTGKIFQGTGNFHLAGHQYPIRKQTPMHTEHKGAGRNRPLG